MDSVVTFLIEEMNDNPDEHILHDQESNRDVEKEEKPCPVAVGLHDKPGSLWAPPPHQQHSRSTHRLEITVAEHAEHNLE